MHRSLSALVVLAMVGLPAKAGAADSPKSVLYLDDSYTSLLNPGYSDMARSFRATLIEQFHSQVVMYAENLGLTQFSGPEYETLLRTYVQGKYSKRPIGLFVAMGPLALKFALTLRSGRWSDTPIVFGSVNEEALAETLSATALNVTGHTLRFSLEEAIGAARMLVPGLEQIALVGDYINTQSFRHQFDPRASFAAAKLKLIDLTGLSMGEIRARVAKLPDRTAIVYTAITTDGAGAQYLPYEALKAFANAANCPIVVDLENRIGHGGTGGPVIHSALLGKVTAQLAIRVLNGEEASSIPITEADSLRYIFDWRELQRWGVAESRLPAGSEFRFRGPGLWEQHRWTMALIVAGFGAESALIIGLLYEARRRRKAEANGRMLLSELAHLNRTATAGELSSSIAHEIRQPLGAMVLSGNAGLNWLKRDPPELNEVRSALQNIVNQGHRVDDIVSNIGALFKKQPLPRLPVNLNGIVRQVLSFAGQNISRNGVRCAQKLTNPAPIVLGDGVQLQQVLLNLVLNAVEAMNSSAPEARFLHVSTESDQTECVMTVADSGPGIDPEHMDDLFKPFFTTKPGGMGLGLSICKSIVEAHGGRLTATARAKHGLVFRIVLPVVKIERHDGEAGSPTTIAV
jgi:signal transduction histidine kinase